MAPREDQLARTYVQTYTDTFFLSLSLFLRRGSEFLKLVDGFDILQIFPSPRSKRSAWRAARLPLDPVVYTARSFMPTEERLSLLDQDRRS